MQRMDLHMDAGAQPIDGLSVHDSATLDARFMNLDAGPAPEGDLRGSVLRLRPLDGLPGALHDALMGLLDGPMRVWAGKRFEPSGAGTNVWGFGRATVGLIPFAWSEGACSDGSGACWRLNYAVPGNVGPLRLIRGECRAMGPGVWLARMNLAIGDGEARVLYFVLES